MSTDNSTLPASADAGNARAAEYLALAAVLLMRCCCASGDSSKTAGARNITRPAVRSMASSWHNFLFASFDPAGFIRSINRRSSLGVQVASVAVFGFHPYSVLLPQVVEGVVCVWLLYHLVRRRFSAPAALLSALLFALAPISVAVNRTNNTDSCLLLVLMLAAWALIKAAEDGSRRQLMLSMAAIGLAFNVKMLAGFIVLPAFFLVYFVCAPVAWKRRVLDLCLAAMVAAACAAAVGADGGNDLRRKPGRSSAAAAIIRCWTDTRHNALRRFISPGSRATPAGAPEAELAGAADPAVANTDALRETRAPRVGARLFVRAPTGPLRLLHWPARGADHVAAAVCACRAAARRNGARLPPADAAG